MATLKPSKGPSHAYLLQLPAHAYQALLNTKELTSEDLVIQFLDQIGRHNTNGLELRAISSVCPRQIALTHARALDEERRNGRLRSDLHGIPIILKVRMRDNSVLITKKFPAWLPITNSA